MTSATEVLRRLLDERGVEYMLDQRYCELFWDFGESGRARASAIGTNGFVQMIVTGLTPEQAIAATLGQGTCHNNAPAYLDFLCSKCGFVHYHSDTNDTGDGNEWHFCPNCGRRVVEVDDG